MFILLKIIAIFIDNTTIFKFLTYFNCYFKIIAIFIDNAVILNF